MINVFDYLSSSEIADVESGNATMDVSVGVQAAFDAAGLTMGEHNTWTDDYRRAKDEVVVPAGTYLIGDLNIYPGSVINFGPRSVFKMKPNCVYGIGTLNYIGQTVAVNGVERVFLNRPRIDMDGNGMFGILGQCLRNSMLYMPEILNAPSGTGYFDDGNGSSVYEKMGISIKGVHGEAGAYWNTIYMPRVKSAAGNVGIGLGTSSNGEEQRSNHNRIIHPYVEGFDKGILISAGGDNYIEMPEVSLNGVGIDIGYSSGPPCKRNTITKVYMESCSTAGIRIKPVAEDTVIEGICSTSGTTTPISDSGVSTRINYYNSDSFPQETLDVFTPIVEGTSTAGSCTYSTRSGTFTRVGKRVFGEIYVVWSGHTGTGSMRIGGLPLTSKPGPAVAVCQICESNISLSANNIASAIISSNTDKVSILQKPVGGGVATNVPMDAAGSIIVSFNYMTA